MARKRKTQEPTPAPVSSTVDTRRELETARQQATRDERAKLLETAEQQRAAGLRVTI